MDRVAEERRAHAVAIGRVDVGGELLERDLLVPGKSPQLEGAPIHGEAVAVDMPRPQGHLGGLHGELKMLRPPQLRPVFLP